MATAHDFFQQAIHTDSSELWRLEDSTPAEFLIKMAAMNADVKFEIAHVKRGGERFMVVTAHTPSGKYEFVFTQDDDLVVDQVL